jgi:hypothetical protein
LVIKIGAVMVVSPFEIEKNRDKTPVREVLSLVG